MELRTRVHTALRIALPVVASLSSVPVSELIAQLHDGVVDLVATDAREDVDAATIEV